MVNGPDNGEPRMAPEPLEVNIEEPVKVEKVRNGGMRLTIGYAILSLAIVLGLYYGFHNDNKLNAEILHRCQTSERIIGVLHREHITKRNLLVNDLHRQKAYLKSVRGGKRPRLPGVSDAEIQKGIDLREQELANEKRIIEETKPTPCNGL